MENSIAIKINHLTSLHEGRYAAGMGISYIGFNLIEGTAHYVSPQAQKAILSWIDGCQIVAEIGKKRITEMASFEEYQVNIIETESWENAASILQEKQYRVIWAVSDIQELLKNIPYFSQYSTDSLLIHLKKRPDALQEVLSNLAQSNTPCLIGFEINVDELLEVRKDFSLLGIALNSSEEEILGIANFEKNAEFIETILEKMAFE